MGSVTPEAEISDANKRAIRVCLYIAISSEEQNRPRLLPLWRRIKRLIARGLDIASWFILRRSRVHYYQWESVQDTNKGDIAIRETIKSQLRKAFAPREVVFDELKWGHLTHEMVAELNLSCDLFVIGGSGYIRSTKERMLAPDLINDQKIFAKLEFPRIAYGIGWNLLLNRVHDEPFTPESNEQLKALLQSIDLVSVRDRATQSLVRDVSGVTPSLIGDPALFFAELFPVHPPSVSNKALRVGLNMAIHGPASAKRIEHEFDSYCSFLKALSQEHKLTFHYVQHAQTECVIPLLLASRGIFAHSHNPPAEKLIDFYRTLDIHICQMMHSSVLSMSSLIPTMNFGYDIKNEGLFDLMELKEFYFSSGNFDHQAALAAALKLIAERAHVATHVLQRKNELRNERDAFLRSMVELTTRRLQQAAIIPEVTNA